MKKISTRVVYDKENQAFLEISWVCSICKYKCKHLQKKKAAFDLNDMLSISAASFNLAFYECGCKGGVR